MTKPNYRTDAMSQTAFSPPRFLLSSASDHPPPTFSPTVYPKKLRSRRTPPSAPIPPRYFCYLQGSIKGRKEGDQVPYFSCRSWWKVSLDETHSGRDPPVIMFQTRHAKKKEVAPVPATKRFFVWLEQNALLGVRGGEEAP